MAITPRQRAAYDKVSAYMAEHDVTATAAIKKLKVATSTYYKARNALAAKRTAKVTRIPTKAKQELRAAMLAPVERLDTLPFDETVTVLVFKAKASQLTHLLRGM